MLNDGDVFIFGGAGEAVINSRTVWALYTTHFYNGGWRVEDTKNMTGLIFSGGGQSTCLTKPEKGTVVSHENGMAIYMGDITYLSGNIAVSATE